MKRDAKKIQTNIYQDDEGYWFTDENEYLQGPYKTLEEASKALSDYCDWLEGKM